MGGSHSKTGRETAPTDAGSGGAGVSNPAITLVPRSDERSVLVGLGVVAASLVSGLATYLIMTGLTPILPTGPVVLTALAINLVLVVALIAMISIQVRRLVRGWRDKSAGARLHVRIVGLFSVIAMLPALVLAISATTTFSRSLDNWFNQRTRAIINNTMEVANAYLEEHGQIIRSDVVNMAKDLDDAKGLSVADPRKFRELVFAQAALRDLPVAYVIGKDRQVQVSAIENEKIPYEAPPEALVRAADAGQVPLLMPTDQRSRIAALTKLSEHSDMYLYVARGVSPKVVRHLRRAEDGVAEYSRLRELGGRLKFIHGLMYFMTALTALTSAIWVGLRFADSIVAPIRRLIAASQTVARGDLSVELPIYRGEGDLRRLSQNFNHMTRQLERQRTELVDTNSQLTERRRFIEAVLAGVSAGVLGLDREGVITLVNPGAERLLGSKSADLVGRHLATAIPAFGQMLTTAAETTRKRPLNEIAVEVGGVERTFAVRLTQERSGEEDFGAVLTFDDVTDLVTAQRTSAWADIARRIAHEIKNPLTPIQLSAERLKRKYGAVVKDDREVFDKCTDTIIRQVGDVARMVDEFSSFARMPKAEMAPMDLRDAVRDPVTLFEHGQNIELSAVLPDRAVPIEGDRRLLSQALTNLVKNAVESVQSVIDAADTPAGFKGRVSVVVRESDFDAIIEVIDNGLGLPKQQRTRLLEPYVTTKGAKGTGLGLAIVQKIVEGHGGTLALEDAPVEPGRERGALVRITLPRAQPHQAEGRTSLRSTLASTGT
ncbi:MAG TPA: PAS domain-containing sensor histidine kinase [Hyphomicrobiaceae bacterium]|nr:PAS domain-containing sensor histidine kinase [Hyphomicrobiaceae bacterium]